MANKRGRPKNPPSVKEMIKDILPTDEIYSEQELVWYDNLVDSYMSDFDKDELTYSDMDDIMDLAKNKILEFRLLKESKDDAARQVDVSTAIEKLRKQNEKIKESLSTRRRDRVNPNDFKGFSIVDIAVAYDNAKKKELESRVEKLNNSNASMRKTLREYTGNREDHDAISEEGDSEEQ